MILFCIPEQQKKLAELYTEKVVYDVDKIIDNFDIKRLHIYKNNIARLRNAIETELKFNFCMKPEIIKNVIDKIGSKRLILSCGLFIHRLGYPPPKVHCK